MPAGVPGPTEPLGPVGAVPAVPVPARVLITAGARSVGIVALTLGAYALLPIREETAWAVGGAAVLGLVVLGMVFVRQLRRIARAEYPAIAGIEALLLVFGMFLTLFAFLYVALSQSDPAAFTQPVGKVAGVYFSVTVLATVGFGDIAAASDAARLVVTFQMVVDLILIGAALRLLADSARRAVQAKARASGPPLGAGPDGRAPR